MDPATQLARAAQAPVRVGRTRLGIRAGYTSYCSDRATS
jgi:hypothetical protein